MNETGQTVQSVERAVQILECFTLEKPEQSLRELAEKTKLSKSTVYRLLSTLAKCGYIKQDELSQKYSLGFKLFNLGSVVAGNMSFRHVALPFMRKLGNEITETISLNIIEEDQRICIEMVESPEEIRNIVKVGQRNELWVGSSGKVLLANLDETERQRILNEAMKQKKLSTEVNMLKKELDEIQKQGICISVDDRVKGSFSISSPIFNHTGMLVGGITVAGPTQRLSAERTSFLIQRLTQTAYMISQAMGFNGLERRVPSVVTCDKSN